MEANTHHGRGNQDTTNGEGGEGTIDDTSTNICLIYRETRRVCVPCHTVRTLDTQRRTKKEEDEKEEEEEEERLQCSFL